MGGITVASSAYRGVVYSPTENRIYFMPDAQVTESSLHYIDCSSAVNPLCAYLHFMTGVESGAYFGGTYCPTSNRIYLAPFYHSNSPTWHYIDCTIGNTVVEYTHGITAHQYGYYAGCYSPNQNRIYLTPVYQANQPTWHYIQEHSRAQVAPQIMSWCLFNKF